MWLIVEPDPKQGPPPESRWYPEAKVFYDLDRSGVVHRIVRGKKDLEFNTEEEARKYSERLARRFIQRIIAGDI